MNDQKANPIRIGWESVKANRKPMFVVWAAVIALAVAYWRIPGFAGVFEPVRLWQERNGAMAAFATQLFFCGVLPALFLATVSEIKTNHYVVKCLLQMLWSGTWGIVYYWFYALQARMFGRGHDLATLLLKTSFDEFVWTPIVICPITQVFYLWMGSDFSVARMAQTARDGYIRRVVLPNILTNWAVWIPTVAAVYAFPLALQIPIMGLVACFWSLVCMQLGRRAHASQENCRSLSNRKDIL